MFKATYLKALLIFILISLSNLVMSRGSAVAVDDQAVVNENSEATLIDVFVNDTLGKGDDLTTFTQPANGTVSLGLFGLTYQPGNGYCNNGVSTDDFTYTLTGGSTATVFVTVTCISNGTTPQVIPVNQLQWLILLFFMILLVAKLQRHWSKN